MIEALALAVVVLAGLYLCALAAASFLMPDEARRFLLGFAASPRIHYIELFARIVAGGSLVIHAPHMAVPGAFGLFGWVLLITTACLFLLPWRWHYRFAQQVVPPVTRYITLVGIGSLALGGLILVAVIRGSAA